MASTYSKLKIELIGTGDQAGQWGTTTNNNLGSSSAGVYRGLEQAIVGMATISSGFVANSYTLPYTDSNDDQEFRCLVLNITASLSNPSDLIVPAIQKPYIVINSSGQTVTVKVSGQTGVAVPNGAKILLYNTGTDVGTAVTYLTELKLGGNLTMPSAGSINDSNGNELIKFPSAVASAVNELTISNAATGSAPTLSATGGDTNIGITLTPKGTGTLFTAGNVSFDGGTFVFNESGADKDFRIEGDTEPNLFFTDASTDRVGIGTSSPADKLQVLGTIRFGANATYYGTITHDASSTGANIYNHVDSGGHLFQAGGTTLMNLTASGNLGLGVTPSAWVGNRKVLAIGGLAVANVNYAATIGENAYNFYFTSGGTPTYQTTAPAAIYDFNNSASGGFAWKLAPSGTAGTAITSFTQAMTLDASGKLQIGTTSAQASSTVSVKGGSVRVYNGQPATVTYDLGPAAVSGDYAYFSWNNTSGSQELKLYGDAGIISFYANATERARITSGGNLCVGATTDNFNGQGLPLVVGSGSGTTGMTVYSGTTGYGTIQFADSTGTGADSYRGVISYKHGDEFMYFSTNATERARITSGGEVYIAGTTDQGAYNLQVNGTGVWGAGAYVNGSDERLKDNIQTLNDGLAVVSQLRPVTFQYKPEHSKDQSVQPGFIAQELQQAMDGKAYLDGVVQSGPEYLNVAYQNLIPILTKAIQEQQALITSLTARVAALEGTQP